MNQEAINKLVELKIKEHFKKENKRITLTKEELIQFCINLLKLIEKY